jgi:hypothetical protein
VIVFSHRQVKPHDSAHPQSIHIHPSIAARRFFCTTTPRTAPRSSKFSVFLSLARVCLDPAVCCLSIPDLPHDGLSQEAPVSRCRRPITKFAVMLSPPVDPPRDGSESNIDVQHSILAIAGDSGSLERGCLQASRTIQDFDDGDDGDVFMDELLIVASIIPLGVLSRYSIKPSRLHHHQNIQPPAPPLARRSPIYCLSLPAAFVSSFFISSPFYPSPRRLLSTSTASLTWRLRL